MNTLRLIYLLYRLYAAGWWSKFVGNTKYKKEEKTDVEVKPEDTNRNLPKLELTEDEYEAFHSKYPLPWWCVIIAYVLSILSILW